MGVVNYFQTIMDRLFNNFKVREHRKILRNNITAAEKILWNSIRGRQIESTKFRRQVSIGNYIVDFFSFEINLAIEVDGKDHQLRNKKIDDEYRQQGIEANDVRFIRFKNEEIEKNIENVLNRIKKKIIELKVRK